MATAPDLSWIPFYEELATRLLDFKDDRHGLIALVLEAYEAVQMKVPKLDSTMPPADIDPFTVMGLFNKGLTWENRAKLAAALKSALGIEAAAPTAFDSIPLLNNQHATFYRFSNDPDRGDQDLEKLWILLETAVAYADGPTPEREGALAEAFDGAAAIKGVRWMVTMGLYWARPNVFMNLDSRNRWFVEKEDVPQTLKDATPREHGATVPSGEEYLQLCRTARALCGDPSSGFRSLPELSHLAFERSEEVNREKKLEQGEVAPDPVLAEPGPRYWLYSPGEQATLWDGVRECGSMVVGWDALGDLSQYGSKAAVLEALDAAADDGRHHHNDAGCAWAFASEMVPGDVVYAKRGSKRLVGRGVVTGEYTHDEEGPEGLRNLRDVEWTDAGEWDWPGEGRMPTKTLTDITDNEKAVARLEALIGASRLAQGAPEASAEPELDPYTREDFLADVYVTPERLDDMEGILRRKKNLILRGAPGTGKTYAAKRLAYEFMGERDRDRVKVVQFHQGYSYEDFVEGYRPTATGFELRRGPFLELCDAALEHPDEPFFLVIDEVNRADLGRVLGELFMLLEADKRGVHLDLMYSRESFTVPRNLYVVGTMNTADRSIALMDHALLRRFGHVELEPAFASDGFRAYAEGLGSDAFDRLVSVVQAMNEDIAQDEALGPSYRVGHSYLCNLTAGERLPAQLREVVEYELAPVAREYWFDDPGKAEGWVAEMRGALA
ncbi:AAA family ATPase [Olsenella sp. YH-ols2217]|uniref:AAA family ATPase n=1 Tax=Kribbibacterium absianum TaxID=3044210 RepID=A0ABT6ZLA6_9ACTN|nr:MULTISPECIES: AAA family ATPase [unclassified Olsenella]MDJ1121820.1 AAA family ATPase [Olsenella sp. YH-ols2216]MDJ1129828.1 AAA family ATPase [Olsenella sp. YH-ols2217]